MHILIGKESDPQLYVCVNDETYKKDPNHFYFDVINGAWRGYFDAGIICYENKERIYSDQEERLVVLKEYSANELRGYNTIIEEYRELYRKGKHNE
jgi:hypothetical protein